MLVKVCGLKQESQVLEIDEIADFLGFIYYDKSLRFVNQAPASSRGKRVGVFVNSPANFIEDKIEKDQLEFVQLHGNESPEFIDQIKQKASIIKAFGIASDFDFRTLIPYENKVDYFLFDTKCENFGGSGKQFNWGALNRYNLTTPFLVAGGINPFSIQALKEIHHPKMAGIDLNSKFEVSPGNKDIGLIKTFIKEFKNG